MQRADNLQSSRPGVLLAKRIRMQDESDSLKRRSKKQKLLKSRSLKSSSNEQRQVDVSFFRGAKYVHVSGGTMTAIINNGSTFSGITLIDAAGKEYAIPKELSISYEVCTIAWCFLLKKLEGGADLQ